MFKPIAVRQVRKAERGATAVMTIAACLLACASTGVQATEGGEQPPASNEAPPFKLETPKLSGYIQVHFRHAEDSSGDGIVDNDDYRVQRVRLSVKGKLYPWLSYDVEVDPRAPEVSGVLRDAFITFHVIPRHELRFGQQKMQFGYENPESSTRLYAVNRTEISDNLSRGINLRDSGIGLIGNIKLGHGLRFEDAVTVGNGEGLNAQADSTAKKNYWGRVGLRYKRDGAYPFVARLGVSAGSGDIFDVNEPDDPTDDTLTTFTRLGTDVQVDHRWFWVSAEYVKGRDKDSASGERTTPSGWYINLVGKTPWHVGPIARFDTLNGQEWQRWTLGAYYGEAEARFRILVNYEIRKYRDGERADDKAYVWTQIKF